MACPAHREQSIKVPTKTTSRPTKRRVNVKVVECLACLRRDVWPSTSGLYMNFGSHFLSLLYGVKLPRPLALNKAACATRLQPHKHLSGSVLKGLYAT